MLVVALHEEIFSILALHGQDGGDLGDLLAKSKLGEKMRATELADGKVGQGSAVRALWVIRGEVTS